MRRIVTVLLALGIVLSAFATSFEPISFAREAVTPMPPSPNGPVVARIYFARSEDAARMARELDVWKVYPTRGYLDALLQPDQYARLILSGYRIEIDEARTALVNHPRELLPGQTEGIPGYLCYRTVEETYTSAEAIVTAHPNLADWIDIGDSWEKSTPGGLPGYDLRVLKLTNKTAPGPKPKIFIMSGIHAREYATAELNTRFAEYLANNYGFDADVTALLDWYEIHLLLHTNPDGRKKAETGLLWRKNTNNNYCANTDDRGADLNRNFDFQWNCCGGSSSDPCDEGYHGLGPASEPETLAVENYVRSEFPDQRAPDLTAPAPLTSTGVFLDLHSYGGDVMWSWGFTPNSPPNGAQLQTLGRKMAYFNGYSPHQSYTMYATDGTTKDFAYGDLGMAGYTIEVGTDFFQDCPTFENTILPGNLPALIYASKATRRPYQSPSGPESLSVTVTPSTTVATRPVTLTAVANDTRYGGSGEPTQNIAAARYTVDAPSWITGVLSYPMVAGDGVFNSPIETVIAVLDTTGWTPGRHTIFVESQDAAGNWGVPTAAFLWITAAPDSAIAGTVRSDVAGMPLAGAAVRLVGGATSQQQTTGTDGRYAFAVFSGTYILTATAPYYYPASLSPVVALSGMTTTQDISLTAIPSGTLAGFVQEAVTGLPLPATVHAVSAGLTYQVTTNPATGAYSMFVLSDTYTVAAQAAGHTSAMQYPVIVRGQQTTTLDFSLPVAICVLLVDDDGGRNYESYFQAGLNQAGILFRKWNVAAQGSPSLAEMTPYPAVLWFTGDDSAFNTLTAQDRANLTAYLLGHGHLFLTGTEIGAGNQNQPFYTDVLYTQYMDDDSGARSLAGGGPFAGLTLTLNGGDGANNQAYPDAIAPSGPAQAVFTYTNGLGGGVVVDTGSYRALNLGFGVEGVSRAADRRAVLERGLAWLGCPALTHQWTLTKTSASTVWSGERLTYTLTLTHLSAITATQVIITDVLPANSVFADASGGGTLNGNEVTWSWANVAPSQTWQVTLAVTATGTVSGTALVNAMYSVRSDQTPTPIWGTPVTATVQAVPPPCVPVSGADFIFTPVNPRVGETVVFSGTVISGTLPITYTWNFDGGVGTGAIVTHVFPITTTPRTYTVTMAVSNACTDPALELRKPVMVLPYVVYLPLTIK